MESTNSSFASDLGQVIIDKLLCDGYALNKWISVEDALPELNTNVLVYAVGKKDCFEDQIAITRFTDTIWFGHEIKTEPYWKDPWQYFHSDYEITHWIPLPEPPEREVQE